MKKIIIYSILTATLLSACRKSDNPKIPTLTRVPVPSLLKEASGSETIIVSDLANINLALKPIVNLIPPP